MSKTETSNTWSEGLVMDLNPMNTPNTVMSDCINGTIITYNGNEFHLQNDQGNYKLKNCKLKPNYIPVGLKEHGDILYIVSCNPLNKTVEIGSYPSPLMISETSDKDAEDNVTSIIRSKIKLGETEGNYTDLMEDSSNILFDGSDFKLNPGDKYCLQASESDLTKYETVEYSILSENAGAYDISDKIILDELDLTNDIIELPDYIHVPWTIPGWLNIKVRLAEISTAGINVKHFYVPKTETGNRTAHYCFNLRLNVDDKFLIEKQEGQEKSLLEAWCDGTEEVGFKVRIIVDGKESDVTEYVLNKDFEWDDWYEDSRILWREISGTISGLVDTSVVDVEVTPFIICEGYKILYNNITQRLTFELQSVDDKIWSFGEQLYQFYLNDNKDGIVVYTNIDGPLISSFPIKIRYNVKSLSGTVIIGNSEIPDYKGVGENIIEIPFSNSFNSEEIYILTIEFFNDQNVLSTINRLLITSEVFSNFTERRVYDRDIKFDEWVNCYWEYVKNEYAIEFEQLSDDSLKSQIIDDEISDKFMEDADQRYRTKIPYNTFFSHKNSGLSTNKELFKGYSRNYLTDCNWIQQIGLKNGLWSNFVIDNNFNYYDFYNKVNKTIVDPNNFNAHLIDGINLTLGYRKINMPFEFINELTVHNLSDNLNEIFNDNNNWSLINRPINISIEIYGRKAKKVDEKLEKKYIKLSLSWGDIRKSFNINKSWDDEGTFYSEHIKQWINSIFKENPNVPFLLVNVQYVLVGRSDNFELEQQLYGEVCTVPGFQFSLEEDGSNELYYVAFRGNEDAEDPCTVLIPISDESGTSFFQTMCRNLKLVTHADDKLITSDRYILEILEETRTIPQLKIQHNLKLNISKYQNVNLLETSEKQNVTRNCKYNTILVEGVPTLEMTKVIFDQKIESTLNESEYPYVSGYDRNGPIQGIQELKGDLNIWSSTSESDFLEWGNSIFYKERFDRKNTFGDYKGFYSEYVSYNDSLLRSITQSYITKSKVELDPAELNINELVSWNKIFIQGNGEIEDQAKQDTTGEASWSGNYAEWITFHNRWKMLYGGDDGATSKDWYVSLGGCWKEDTSTLLTQKWNWITHGL